MPRFKVNGKSAFAFAAALVNIAAVSLNTRQHGDNAVAGAVGAADITARCADIMNAKPMPPALCEIFAVCFRVS